MKTIVDKAASRGYYDHAWLKTHHTFSFADYYNRDRMNFGALRVLNDDIIAPGRGFDMHPHRNMEVISIPLKGYLTHGDSVENTSTITPGDIQVMSTGRGIYHSEYNGSQTEDVHLLQIWVLPKAKETAPEYRNYDVRSLLKKNELGVIIAPDGSAPASILQDAWFSMGTFDAGQVINYKMHKDGQGVYLFVIEGSVSVLGEHPGTRDGMGVWDTKEFQINVAKNSQILLMEVPM